MNIVSIIFRRKPISTTLLILVLMCSITMGTIGSASMISAGQQIQNIEDFYTTIAYPGNMEDGVYGELTLPNDSGVRKKECEKTIAENIVMEDVRSCFLAHTPEHTSITPYEFHDYEQTIYNGLNNSFIVAAGTCENVSKEIVENAMWTDEDGEKVENPYYNQIQYTIDFELEKIVCCSDGHKTLEKVDGITFFSLEICDEDGKCLFEEGKSYLLFGMASSDPGIIHLGGGKCEFPSPFYISLHYKSDFDTAFCITKKIDDQERRYYVLEKDSFPVCVEYEGDVEEFLESEEGSVWREKVIPYCQMNYQSASVIGTNNLDSIPLFNNRVADILEGREFQSNDYIEGNKVCLVSTSYANKNKLKVGDRVRLELYKGGMGESEIYSGEVDYAFPVRYQKILKQENRLGIEGEWKIVGIYSAPDFIDGEANFNANTILVPKKSLPSGEEYEDEFDPLLYSIVLKNGTEEKFAKAIKPYIIGEPFRYANQGYDTVKESVNTMMKNAKRLCLACSAGAVISLVLVLFLLWKRLAVVVSQMRMLGCSKGRTFRQTMVALLPTIGVSGVLGGVITIGCCKKLLDLLIKTELLVQSSTIIICVVVEMALVVVVFGIVVNLMLKHKLINRNVE